MIIRSAAWLVGPLLAMGAVLGFIGTSSARTYASSLPVGWSVGPNLPASYNGLWDMSYAYDAATDQVVVFGGSPKTEVDTWSNQTWIYHAGQWSQGPSAPSGLTPRGGSAMAYDPDINRIVLFGGGGQEWPYPHDMWLWDGSQWTPGATPPAALAGRTGAKMVYDPDTHKLVLFGGSGAVPYTETWFFDGTAWTRGPDAPPAMGPRSWFGMEYDPIVHKVYLAGGNGKTDGWYFDGSSWTPGPSTDPVGPPERLGNLTYDPQLGGLVLFSGLGPGNAAPDWFVLRNGTWTNVSGWTGNLQGTPPGRTDGIVVWEPAQDALMVAGGIDDILAGTVPFTDTWYFREVPPQIASLSITPSNPVLSNTLKMAVGATSNGYGKLSYTYQWYVNGQLVTGVTGKSLKPTFFRVLDQVSARAIVTDGLGFSGQIDSQPVTIADRKPTIGSVSLSPSKPYLTNSVTATANSVKDPDGDSVTIHYVWKVNSTVKGGDSQTLAPSNFTATDTVTVTVTPIDSHGLAGVPVTSNPSVVLWNITPNGSVTPGSGYSVKGGGYQANERVDIMLDSTSATPLATLTADSGGLLVSTSVTIPSPLAGGSHFLYGVGKTSGLVGRGPLTVIASGALTPKAVGAGDSTMFSGVGFVPGETVSAAFPGGVPATQVADAAGSVSVGLTSPPEAVSGGVVTASAPSGLATGTFTVITRATLPATAHPQDVVLLTATGFQPGEPVDVSFNGGPVAATYTADAAGSVSGPLTLNTFFGNNQTVTVRGEISAAQATPKIALTAWLALNPTGGPSGTTIEVTSGPGWSPGETLHIWWGTQDVKDVQADANGAIDTSFVAPAHNPANVTVKITESVLGLTPTATFTVTSARGEVELR